MNRAVKLVVTSLIIVGGLLLTIPKQQLQALFSTNERSSIISLFTASGELSFANLQVPDMTNWLPGEERTFEFKIANESQFSMAYTLEMEGGWVSAPQLAPVWILSEVAVLREGQWEVVATNVPMGDIFTPTLSGDPLLLHPSQIETYKIALLLPETVDNEYQEKSFDATIVVNGTQLPQNQ